MHQIVLIGNLGRLEKNAPAHFWTEAKVTDQVKSHAPQHADASVFIDGAATSYAFPDPKKNVSTLQARFALQGWQLDPDPGVNGRMRYIATRWGRSTRILHDLEEVRSLLAQIGGEQ
jgi:hypothetical protein